MGDSPKHSAAQTAAQGQGDKHVGWLLSMDTQGRGGRPRRGPSDGDTGLFPELGWQVVGRSCPRHFALSPK